MYPGDKTAGLSRIRGSEAMIDVINIATPFTNRGEKGVIVHTIRYISFKWLLKSLFECEELPIFWCHPKLVYSVKPERREASYCR